MVSENIKRYRKEAGITQSKLAELIHTKQNTVSQYESGGRNPSVKRLLEIADALGVSVDAIVGGDAI